MERFSGDDDFRVMKASYMKNQADAALKAGNVREAYTRYTECLDVLPTGAAQAVAVYSNRSLAYAKARKFDLALADAEEACALNAEWDKAWWRKASALRGLKQLNEALEAYRTSYDLTPDKMKGHGEYWTTVTEITRQMTREQLAEYVVSVLNDYEAKGLVEPPGEQNVTDYEKKEAMFCHIRNWHRDGHKSEKDYCEFVAKWVLNPMSVKQAYLQRACMYKEALCFKQVVADAQTVIQLCGDDQEEHSEEDVMIKTVLAFPGTAKPFEKRRFLPKAWARCLQGFGYKATKSSEAERDLVKAAKCFKIAIKLDDKNSEYQTEFDEVSSQLSNAQMSEVLNDTNDQRLIAELGLPEDFANKFKKLYRVNGSFRYECCKLSFFGGAAREAFKDGIAKRAGVGFRDVLIERVSLVDSEGATASRRCLQAGLCPFIFI